MAAMRSCYLAFRFVARMVTSTGISVAMIRKFKIISDIFKVHRICTNLVANSSNTPCNRLEGAQTMSDELQASVAIPLIPTGQEAGWAPIWSRPGDEKYSPIASRNLAPLL
jgi:hypothetical protein